MDDKAIQSKKEKAKKWAEENKEAIEAYNKRVLTNGIWSDKHRRF